MLNLISNGWIQMFLVDHLTPNCLPRCLVQFINGGADGAEHVDRYTALFHHGVQHLTVVNFDDKLANIQLGQDLGKNPYYFCIRCHHVVLTGNVKVTLVKLSKATAGC